MLRGFIAKFTPPVARVARATLERVEELVPGSLQRVYDAYNALAIGFATGDSLGETFVHVAVYPKHVNLGFNAGAFLPDPHGLLVGSGTSIRHVKIEKPERLGDPRLATLVREAAKRAGHEGGDGGIVVVRVYAKQRDRQ
jgi:hypothetical protein